ncbi:hypothetical protein PBI_PEREGRIN_176 [Rhodococcus phage Peregrin]|nr:hypothetical protein PBI_PEREGRIN_176 [Rhodococcus phage Peregrin]
MRYKVYKGDSLDSLFSTKQAAIFYVNRLNHFYETDIYRWEEVA